MVLYNDDFHPAKQWNRAYTSDDMEVLYGVREGIGNLPVFLAVHENQLLEAELNNGYTFRIHPGSVYLWAPEVTWEDMQILASAYLEAGYNMINHEISSAVYKYIEE